MQQLTDTRISLADLPDAQLTGRVADQVAVPRHSPADSFVLHAPLELLARTALLPYVDADSREPARGRIIEIADIFSSYEAEDFPPRSRPFEGCHDAVRYLADAMSAKDLDAADDAANWLGTHLSPSELSDTLADSIVASLAAAGHAPIFLWLAPRVSPRWNLTGRLLRPLIRELTRNSSMQLRWIDGPRGHQSSSTGADMTAALAAAPQLGEGPSNFIYPTMSRIDTPDLAPALLGSVCARGDIADRGRAVMRAAAWSMLGEPTTHSAYGWSHALTMSQATIGVAGSCADPSRALSIAATYVMGFRASLAVRPLVEQFEPERSDLSSDEAIAAGAEEAASAAWHLPDEQRGELVTLLASRASAHPDAHQAKYTLACLDAVGDDPPAARLYLAAAAKLVGFWASQPIPDDH